jgi:hypothetical protein
VTDVVPGRVRCQQILRTASPQKCARSAFLVDTFDRPEARLVPGSRNGILPGTPLENVDAFLEEALVYGEKKRNP